MVTPIAAVAVIRVAIDLLRLVSMRITPLAPLAPYSAVPLRITVTFCTSFMLRFDKMSLNKPWCKISRLYCWSTGTPSITIRGCAFTCSEFKPFMKTAPPVPGVPLWPTTWAKAPNCFCNSSFTLMEVEYLKLVLL